MFQYSLKSILTRFDLQKEKAKDYRNIVVIQMIIIVAGLTLTEPLLQDSQSSVSKLITTIFSAFAAIYAFLLWDLLRNFTNSKALIITIFITLSIVVIIGLLGEFPYYQVIHVQNRQIYLLMLHGILFPIEVTVIIFALRDLFSEGFLTSDKLWGAACVFLMVGISFGSLYDLISIAKPGSLGINVELGLPNYAECVAHSFSVLGGIDTDLTPTKLIKNISIIESIGGMLYGMLIIGKLLSLPKQEETQKSN
jgi:hypothetical protein